MKARAIVPISLFVSGLIQASPILNETQELLASDGAPSDYFGVSVAVSNNRILIGAYGDDDSGSVSGSAYLYESDGNGGWVETKFTASDGKAGDLYGLSVALSGDRILVGAYGDDDNGYRTGSAYLYEPDGSGGWRETKLTASDGAPYDSFGHSVALSGDRVLIGAYGDDDNGTRSGSAYLFEPDGSGGWSETKLTASDGTTNDEFGLSVALSGDTVLIGAIGGDSKGSAYLFEPVSSGGWSETKFAASDGANSDYFGYSVALSDNRILIGTIWDDDNGSNSGSAYLFEPDGSGGWTESKLSASDGAASDWFGSSVALSGDRVLVGAMRDDDNSYNSGSVYLFEPDGSGGWAETAKLLPSDGNHSQLTVFTGLWLEGSSAVVGSYYHTHAGHPTGKARTGAALLFTLASDDQPPQVKNLLTTPNPAAMDSAISVTALIDDTGLGDSVIESAELTVDGSGANAMTAVDGGFDGVTESVSAGLAGFSEAGVHTLCVTGTDAEGNQSEAVCTLLAVYDPSAGFVTGGGWIHSPVGAYQADPSLSGKAEFGFVSKYQKGKSVPSGNTEFLFEVGNLSFESTSYEWLVIAGSRAQYKGEGLINGGGHYGFMLFAIDGGKEGEDKFRIQIWDKANDDALVYDNEVGAGEDADPITTLGGGSIMVHNKGKR